MTSQVSVPSAGGVRFPVRLSGICETSLKMVVSGSMLAIQRRGRNMGSVTTTTHALVVVAREQTEDLPISRSYISVSSSQKT